MSLVGSPEPESELRIGGQIVYSDMSPGNTDADVQSHETRRRRT